jgi:hypothetical protein
VPLLPSLPMKTLLHVVCRWMQMMQMMHMMHMMVPRPMEASMPSPQMMRPPQTTMMPQPAEERHQQSDSGGPRQLAEAWTSGGRAVLQLLSVLHVACWGSRYLTVALDGVYEQSGGVSSVLGHIGYMLEWKHSWIMQDQKR